METRTRDYTKERESLTDEQLVRQIVSSKSKTQQDMRWLAFQKQRDRIQRELGLK